MRAVEAYFRTYGPATPDRVHDWLGEGLGAGRKRIRSWIAASATAWSRSRSTASPRTPCARISTSWPDAADDRRATPAGIDQWVLGPARPMPTSCHRPGGGC